MILMIKRKGKVQISRAKLWCIPTIVAVLFIGQLVLNRMMARGVLGQTEAAEIIIIAAFWLLGVILFGLLAIVAMYHKHKSILPMVASVSLCIAGLIAMYIAFES